MKKIFVVSLALMLFGAGCSGQAPVVTNTAAPVSPPAQNSDTGVKTTQNITIQNFAFSPKTLTVKRGDAVVFKNSDSVTHTVTADGGAFDGGQIQSGSSYTLDTATLAAGSYAFHCAPHPTMTATLIVQ
ncbi:MAG: cupredoxin domain-containing protein [Patescibacteria group bacterium]